MGGPSADHAPKTTKKVGNLMQRSTLLRAAHTLLLAALCHLAFAIDGQGHSVDAGELTNLPQGPLDGEIYNSAGASRRYTECDAFFENPLKAFRGDGSTLTAGQPSKATYGGKIMKLLSGEDVKSTAECTEGGHLSSGREAVDGALNTPRSGIERACAHKKENAKHEHLFAGRGRGSEW